MDAPLLAQAIRTRRTVKAFTGAPVTRAALVEALDLARWAPTHGLREPWHFSVVEQPGVARLSAFFRIDPAFAPLRDGGGKSAAKLEQMLTRMLGVGAMIAVSWHHQEDPALDSEDHSAAAAAVQNLLLALHAQGLSSYWSTSGVFMEAATLRWFGLDPDSQGALGCIWIGHAVAQPPAPPRRPLEERVRWLG